ncbi:MAG TPA: hypothetical protein VGF28_21960 [Thermoanaerobaculia bacterium]|jgi:hypothetical protein
MEILLVTVTPSVTLRMTVLFLFFYPFAVWLAALRRASPPLGASVVPAALAPLFAGVTAAWLELNALVETLPLAGGSRIARVAGVAETQVLLALAAAVAAVVAGVACAGEFLRRAQPVAEAMSPAWRRTAVILISLAAFELYALASTVTTLSTGAAPSQPGRSSLLLAAAASAFLGLAASLVWLVASHRTPAARIAGRRTACAVSTITALVIAFTAWQVANALHGLAVRGG